jgi:alkylation response protein AidB-like acyl-CoA dehydrogenase
MIYTDAANATLIDSWTTSGLKGTASDDFKIHETFVPADHTFDLFGAPLDASPIWLLPASLRFAMSKAAAVCGIARGAMDALFPLLERTPFAGRRAAREEPRVQIKLALAEAALEGGRAYLYRSVEDAWRQVESGRPLEQTGVAGVRLAVVFAAQQAMHAVHLIHELGGTAAVLDPFLDRTLRDSHVARQHLQLQDHIVEDVGRVLVGMAPQNPMF